MRATGSRFGTSKSVSQFTTGMEDRRSAARGWSADRFRDHLQIDRTGRRVVVDSDR